MLFRSVLRITYEHPGCARAEPGLYPIWLELSISGQSIFKKKLFKKIEYEKLLLILAAGTLFISFSRIGWITMIILASYVFFRLTNTWIKGLSAKQKDRNISLIPARQLLFRLGVWFGLLAGLMAVILFAGIVLTRIDPRMAGLFDIQRFRGYGCMGWAARLSFAEELFTGWQRITSLKFSPCWARVLDYRAIISR